MHFFFIIVHQRIIFKYKYKTIWWNNYFCMEETSNAVQFSHIMSDWIIKNKPRYKNTNTMFSGNDFDNNFRDNLIHSVRNKNISLQICIQENWYCVGLWINYFKIRKPNLTLHAWVNILFIFKTANEKRNQQKPQNLV